MPGFIGFPELVLLAVVALVVLGPKRLPEAGRALGDGMRAFRSGLAGDATSGIVDRGPVAVRTTTHASSAPVEGELLAADGPSAPAGPVPLPEVVETT